MRILLRPKPTTPTDALLVVPTAIKIATRPKRVLDFDVECRPLTFLGSDFNTKEITAMAWAWTDKPADVTCHLLGETDLPTMLGEFVKAYNYADMVTGHFIRCMTPETRVLTADLRWLPAGDLRAGQSLLTFDEHGSPHQKRRLRFASVLSNRPRMEPVYAVELETGQVLHATAEHPWFVGTRNDRNAMRFHWRRTDELLGASPVMRHQFAKRPVWLYQVFDPWDQRDSRDLGWLAGFFDGEGTLGRAGSAGEALQITAAQNPGVTLHYALDLLHRNGFEMASDSRRSDALKAHTLRVNGGINGALRFLGQVRPQRLLRNWLDRPTVQALRQIRMVKVMRIVPAGEREVSGLSTSTHTYFAEGYAVHNSFDLPLINGALTEFQMPMLADKLTHDTKLDAGRRHGMSNSQESWAAQLECEHAKEQMDQIKWRKANRLRPDGLVEARRRVIGDVRQHMEMRAKMLALGYLSPPQMWRSGTARAESYTP